MAVKVGQIYRDTYFDGKREECTYRTIRIIEIVGTKAKAETLTDVRGNLLEKPRHTRVSFKTLQSGYALVTA